MLKRSMRSLWNSPLATRIIVTTKRERGANSIRILSFPCFSFFLFFTRSRFSRHGSLAIPRYMNEVKGIEEKVKERKKRESKRLILMLLIGYSWVVFHTLDVRVRGVGGKARWGPNWGRCLCFLLHNLR